MATLRVTADEVLDEGLLEPETPAGDELPLAEPPVEEAPTPDGDEQPAEDASGVASQLLDQISDEKIEELTHSLEAVVEGVSVDVAEGLVDAFSDYVEAALALKSKLSAATLSVIPGRQMHKKMEDALRPMLEEVRPFEPAT